MRRQTVISASPAPFFHKPVRAILLQSDGHSMAHANRASREEIMPAITEQPGDTLVSRTARDQHWTDLLSPISRPVLPLVGVCKSLLLSLASYLLAVRIAGANTFLVGLFLICGKSFIKYRKLVAFGIKQALLKVYLLRLLMR